jgi:hypothetical protein
MTGRTSAPIVPHFVHTIRSLTGRHRQITRQVIDVDDHSMAALVALNVERPHAVLPPRFVPTTAMVAVCLDFPATRLSAQLSTQPIAISKVQLLQFFKPPQWRAPLDGVGRRCLRQRDVGELLRHVGM